MDEATYRYHFTRGFESVMSGLVGDLSGFRALREQIVKLAWSDSWKLRQLLITTISRDAWSWPEYERQLKLREEAEGAWDGEDDDSEPDPCFHLGFLSLSELRALAGSRAKGRGIEALLVAMQKAFSADEIAAMEANAKKLVTERWAQRDYEERCGALAGQFAARGNQHMQLANYAETLQSIPGLKMKLLLGPHPHPECKKLAGKLFKALSSEHRENGPCRWLDCGCCWVPVVPSRQ